MSRYGCEKNNYFIFNRLQKWFSTICVRIFRLCFLFITLLAVNSNTRRGELKMATLPRAFLLRRSKRTPEPALFPVLCEAGTFVVTLSVNWYKFIFRLKLRDLINIWVMSEWFQFWFLKSYIPKINFCIS